MDAVISYQGNLFKLFDITKFDESNGAPATLTFYLRVISGMYSGTAPCEYYLNDFYKFIYELEEMYQFKRNEILFKDIEYGQKVVFALDQHGHITIKGDIYDGNYANGQRLKFSLSFDQTFLPDFIRQLKQVTV